MATTTTTAGISPWALPYAQNLLEQSANDIFTTIPDPNDPTKTIVTGIKPYVPYAGEAIAGFTPEQLANQQQFAQLQTPQGFQQGAAGLGYGQQMGFNAGNQGLNQAFSYQAQPQQSLAIPQQSWFPSGSNAPQAQQPTNPFTQGMQSVVRQPQQTPTQQQDFQRGMGITNVNGQLTFADTASPFSSSATPASSGQGLVDARLASRGLPPQTQPGATSMAPTQTTPTAQTSSYQHTLNSPQQARGVGATPEAIAFNKQFAMLNNIPYDPRQNQESQMDYFKTIARNNQAEGGSAFKLPQGFAEGGKVSPYTAPQQTPEQQQAFQQGMGINNVGGQSTFAGNASPSVSSATPTSSGQGLVDARLASRGAAPQTPPATTLPATPGQTTYNTTTPIQPPPGGWQGFGGTMGPAVGQQPPAFGQQPDSSTYESKYQQGVTDIALREAQRQADVQRAAGAMSSIGRGTFGGARQALIQSEADRNNAQNMANVQAMGSQAGFQNAQQQFNADRASNIGVQTQNQNVALEQQKMNQQGQQFQAGLGRDIGIAGLGAGNAASANLGNLSGQQQIADLQRLQAQAGSAAQKQALQQQIDSLNAQNYYNAQQYPIQRAGQLNDIMSGRSVGSVGTSSTPTNLAGQIVGGGIALGGAYLRNADEVNAGISNLVNWATT